MFRIVAPALAALALGGAIAAAPAAMAAPTAPGPRPTAAPAAPSVPPDEGGDSLVPADTGANPFVFIPPGYALPG